MMHLSKLYRKRMVTILALTLALGLGLALPAQAITTLDFAMGPPQYSWTELKFDGGIR